MPRLTKLSPCIAPLAILLLGAECASPTPCRGRLFDLALFFHLCGFCCEFVECFHGYLSVLVVPPSEGRLVGLLEFHFYGFGCAGGATVVELAMGWLKLPLQYLALRGVSLCGVGLDPCLVL